MAIIDLSSYKKLYIQTANEYCNKLASVCRRAFAEQNKEGIKEIHIAAHSLRTQSETMGYKKTAILAGLIEKIAKNIFDSKGGLSNELLSSVKGAVKDMRDSLILIEKEGKEKDLSISIKKLETVLDNM